MKKLAIAVLALTIVAAVPKGASAQQAQSSGMDGGGVLATLAGAVVGGAIGYYYFTGQVATVVGVLVGGAIGSWWYNSADGSGPAGGGKMKMLYTETPHQPFQLIGYEAGRQPGLRMALGSSARE